MNVSLLFLTRCTLFWENDRTQRNVGIALVAAFLAGLLTIELQRRGLMPPPLDTLTPSNHFYAVDLAFTLVLVLEVISLIFTLPCSFSRSVGKQFEILALILLRDSFKELSAFPEPITVAGNVDPVLLIVAYAFGSLIILPCSVSITDFSLRANRTWPCPMISIILWQPKKVLLLLFWAPLWSWV